MGRIARPKSGAVLCHAQHVGIQKPILLRQGCLLVTTRELTVAVRTGMAAFRICTQLLMVRIWLEVLNRFVSNRSGAYADQDARQAPSFRAGKDSADIRSCCERQSGVFCCSMYWRTMLMGAPPQEEAK